jgi:hypothetical protein
MHQVIRPPFASAPSIFRHLIAHLIHHLIDQVPLATRRNQYVTGSPVGPKECQDCSHCHCAGWPPPLSPNPNLNRNPNPALPPMLTFRLRLPGRRNFQITLCS